MTDRGYRAVACALLFSLCLSIFSGCGRDLGDLTEPPPETESTTPETVIVTMDAEMFESIFADYPDLSIQTVVNESQNSPSAAPSVPAGSVASSSAAVPPASAAPTANNSAAPSAPASSQNAAPVSPLNYSKEELLTYFNNCVNKIKADKPGFTREEQSGVDDIVLSNSVANSLVGFVKGMLLSEDLITDKSAKGANCDALVPVEGTSYSSKLTISDIENITVKQEGDGYTMVLTMPPAANPDMNSSYGKIFDFVTIDDVATEYAPEVGATVAKEDISTAFSGCTATLTVDGQGRPTHYETNVSCKISLKNGTIKKVITITSDVDFSLVTKTVFKDFVW